MSYLEQIDKSRIPKHIAIIMDGNGRWAKQKNLDRTFGHKEGLEAVRKSMKAAAEVGISYLTLYTFSTENWNRPKEEVDALMDLMVQAVANETAELIENNLKVKTIGDIDRLPSRTRQALQECLEATSECTGMVVILALSYSSKWELTKAIKEIVTDVENGKFKKEDIEEITINQYLTTAGIPDPELLIRTGGELRLSNFLLWQTAYSELYFTDELWPDFNEESLFKAIVEFQNRERRFGKTSEQISKK